MNQIERILEGLDNCIELSKAEAVQTIFGAMDERIFNRGLKAVGFLRQPTSTATGVREYNKHLMDAYDLTEDEFNLMADRIQDKFLSV